MNILTGLRVVELSAFVAVPLGGATLAAMGADVIRVDPIGGGLDIARLPTAGGRSLYWAGLNQGKRSVTVDLRSPKGREVVEGLLIASGDDGGIVITNLPDQGWSSYERLRAARPDLIMVALSGASDGSAAVDYTVNARLGFPMITGPADSDGPTINPLPAWDAQAGYLVALAVVAAERHRSRTGEGQLVRLSLMDVGLTLTARLGILAEAALITEPRGRHGNFVYGTFARDLPTRDGRHLMVVALTARQWASLATATGIGPEAEALAAARGLDLARDAARWELRHEIAQLLVRWSASRDLPEIARALEAEGVLWAPFRNFKQLLREEDEPLTASPVLGPVSDRGIGEYLLPRSPLRFGAFAPEPIQPPPRLGQHTDEVLRELLGVGDQELQSLHERGAIGG